MSKKEQTLSQANTPAQAISTPLKNHTLEADTSSSIIPDVQVKAGQRAPRRTFSTTYKLNILEAYDACDNALARGALLRQEGLYHARLSAWRKLRHEKKLGAKKEGSVSKAARANQELIRQNNQLKKKLAQAEAVIDLQKKISNLFGTCIPPANSSEDNS